MSVALKGYFVRINVVDSAFSSKGGALRPDQHTLDVGPLAESLGKWDYIVELPPQRETPGENQGCKQREHGFFTFRLQPRGSLRRTPYRGEADFDQLVEGDREKRLVWLSMVQIGNPKGLQEERMNVSARVVLNPFDLTEDGHNRLSLPTVWPSNG